MSAQNMGGTPRKTFAAGGKSDEESVAKNFLEMTCKDSVRAATNEAR